MVRLRKLTLSRRSLVIYSIFIALALALIFLSTQLATAADEALNVRTHHDGTYGMVSDGVGFEDIAPGTGDIVLDVPGPVVQAYLVWAGQDEIPPGGDDTISLSVNGGPANSITTLRSYGPEWWHDPPPVTRYNYAWVADVTSYVLQGTNTYTIDGFGTMYAEFGVGLLVVYQDGALPYSFVEIVEGLDGAYHSYLPPRGPNTEVACVQFAATASPRTMNLSFFVGGVNISGALRPDAIWYQTGSALPLPTDLVDQPGATEIGGQPLNSKDGPEWDTYHDSIPVPAGDTWACFQIESIEDPVLNGASLFWFNLTVSMAQAEPTETPTPTNTFTPTPTNTFTPTPSNTAPAVTDTPTPTPTSSDTPTPTNTSPPTSTFTPGPTSTSSPVPSATPSSPPGPTSTPDPSTPTPTSTPSLPISGFGDEFGLPALLILGFTSAALVFLSRFVRSRLVN